MPPISPTPVAATTLWRRGPSTFAVVSLAVLGVLCPDGAFGDGPKQLDTMTVTGQQERFMAQEAMRQAQDYQILDGQGGSQGGSSGSYQAPATPADNDRAVDQVNRPGILGGSIL